jgi:hypothetical protein
MAGAPARFFGGRGTQWQIEPPDSAQDVLRIRYSPPAC